MVSILRQPDFVYGATEASPFRFEEDLTNDVKYEYKVDGNSAKVIVYPSGSPVKYLKLRFSGDLQKVDKVFGDQWERVGIRAYLEWRSMMASRILPWYCYLLEEGKMSCYGVKTGADCFAFFQVDTDGITLFLDLCCGADGTDLQAPLLACEVVELFGEKGEDCYQVACKFAKRMCENPVLPKQPIFGVNNWYWAYGDISHEIVMEETDQLIKLTKGCKHRPYMIIDDGWEKNRVIGLTGENGVYIGGEWEPNERFGDMRKTAEGIRAKGAKPGIWFRPLLTREELPEEVKLCQASGGTVLDPSHPFTLKKVEQEARKFVEWGFELIKHDFTTIEATGIVTLSSEQIDYGICKADRHYFDRTKTTATILKNLYKAIQKGAGDSEVIGCNTISHLTAGIHSTYRIGNDTSGRAFEWTRRDGVNSVMRLPLNNVFYNADPDCAPFTERVKFEANLDFLEMCALTGMTTLASIRPGVLSEEEMKEVNRVFLIADADKERYGLLDFDKNAFPERFVSADGKEIRRFNWNKIYNGSRVVLTWYD